MSLRQLIFILECKGARRTAIKTCGERAARCVGRDAAQGATPHGGDTSSGKMPNSITVVTPLTYGRGEAYGNEYRQLACGPVVAASHVNAAIDSVVPTLSSLVGGGSTVATLMYDSAEEPATSVKAYRDGLSRGARALVGPSYSSIAAYLALLGGIDQVPVCSYWASSPSLSSRVDFPYFGRTYPSDKEATKALPEMINALGWKSVAVIHTNNDYSIQYAEGLHGNAPVFGVNVIATWEFQSGNQHSISVAVKNIRDSGANIFVAICSSDSDLSTIFYEAEEQGIVGENFAWLTTDSVSAEAAIEAAPDRARTRRLMDRTINVRVATARTVSSAPRVRVVGIGLG